MKSSIRTLIFATILVLALTSACGSTDSDQTQAEAIRSIECRRVRALVEGDIETARQLHANDFQLITPLGDSLTKEQYLGAIASGAVDYLVWDPEPIEVRLYGSTAVIRYQSQIEVITQGQKTSLLRYWHTDLYEQREGQWQVVWSQATQAR
jgi:hypothetical protein